MPSRRSAFRRSEPTAGSLTGFALVLTALLATCLVTGWTAPLGVLLLAVSAVLIGASVLDNTTVASALSSGRYSGLGAAAVATMTGLLVPPPKPAGREGE